METQDTPMPSDSSVRLVASPTLNYALILAMLGSYGCGAWFLATQTATNAAVADRFVRFETTVTARLDAGDRREDARAVAVDAIGNRLTRMEAQLAFLVAAGGRR